MRKLITLPNKNSQWKRKKSSESTKVPENIINDLRFFFLSPAAKKQPLSFEFIARHFCRKKVDFPAI